MGYLEQSVKQEARLIMNVAMEQAFHVLQMPTMELKDYLEKEIEQNPLLEITPSSSNRFNIEWIANEPTLYEHLLSQILFHFDLDEEKESAKKLAGSLDDKGFLTLSSEELKGKEEILKKFQRMDVLGLGARNAQEALLIQLEDQKDGLLYKMVAHHYHDLLHQRYEKIAKALSIKIEEVQSLIHHKLRTLNPFPGRAFGKSANRDLIADLSLFKEGETWTIEINDTFLPSFQIHQFYLDRLENSEMGKEELNMIRRFLAAGKWLDRILNKRKKNLQEIGGYLLKKQKDFLEEAIDTPTPMTMREVAIALEVSESTITRTISNKAIATPRGLFKLRDLFTQGIASTCGIISNQVAKNLLLKLIAKETKPLSDSALSKLLKQEGILCARRTITKYRNELKIGSASQRKRGKPALSQRKALPDNRESDPSTPLSNH